MKNYTHILVPLELSSHSIQTLDAAYNLAQQHKAELSVVHVLDTIPASWVVNSSSDEIPDAIARVFGGEVKPHNSEKLVMERLGHLCSSFDVPRKNIHLCMGDVKKEILSMAEKYNIDLIVVGYHHSKHLNPLTHSIAQEILKEANCDVLTIGAHSKSGVIQQESLVP